MLEVFEFRKSTHKLVYCGPLAWCKVVNVKLLQRDVSVRNKIKRRRVQFEVSHGGEFRSHKWVCGERIDLALDAVSCRVDSHRD